MVQKKICEIKLKHTHALCAMLYRHNNRLNSHDNQVTTYLTRQCYCRRFSAAAEPLSIGRTQRRDDRLVIILALAGNFQSILSDFIWMLCDLFIMERKMVSVSCESGPLMWNCLLWYMLLLNFESNLRILKIS